MTDEDVIYYEIIHKLAIEDLTYSQIESGIPNRLTTIPAFETILSKVSVFHEASNYSDAYYSLNEQYWYQFNPSYPRYTPKELQKGLIRYHEFMKSKNRVKTEGLLPKLYLYNIHESFSGLKEILWCPSMLYIDYIVLLKRNTREVVNDYSLYFILEIIDLAVDHAPVIQINNEEELNLLKSTQMNENRNHPFLNESFDINLIDSNKLPAGHLLSLLTQLYLDITEPDLLGFVKSILLRIGNRFLENKQYIKNKIPALFPDDENSATSEKNDGLTEEERRKLELKEKSRKHQQSILNQFKAKQSEFLQTSKELKTDEWEDEEDDEDDDIQFDDENDINLLNKLKKEENKLHTCVLCRESCTVKQSIDSNRPIGSISLLQRSNLVKLTNLNEKNDKRRKINILKFDINEELAKGSKKMTKSHEKYKKEKRERNNLQQAEETQTEKEKQKKITMEKQIIINLSENEGMDIKYCGHIVHVDCMYDYFSNLCKSHQANRIYEGSNMITLLQGEFICPSCRRLANSVTPLVQNHHILNHLFITPYDPPPFSMLTNFVTNILQISPFSVVFSFFLLLSLSLPY